MKSFSLRSTSLYRPIGNPDPPFGRTTSPENRRDMTISCGTIGKGVTLGLAGCADPPPTGFDNDHAEQIKTRANAITPANVARRVKRHQLDRIRGDCAFHGAKPTKSTP